MSLPEGVAVYRPQGTNIEISTEKELLIFNGAVFSFDLLHALSACVNVPLVLRRGHEGRLLAEPFSPAERGRDMSSSITQDHLKRLNDMTVPELGEVWSSLNRGEWPHDKLPLNGEIDYDRYSRIIMQNIAQEIGMKACLRACNKDRMTPDEFEAWWDKRPRFQ